MQATMPLVLCTTDRLDGNCWKVISRGSFSLYEDILYCNKAQECGVLKVRVERWIHSFQTNPNPMSMSGETVAGIAELLEPAIPDSLGEFVLPR